MSERKKSGGREREAADKSGSKRVTGDRSSGSKSAGQKKNRLKIVSNSASVKTGKGKSKTRPGPVLDSVGGSAGVDTRAIKRMLNWQLELLDRLRILTLSAIEVVEDKPE